MTVIAVKKYPDKIVIAADTQQTWGDHKKNLSKIIQENNLVAAAAGCALDISLFRMFLRTRRPKAPTEEDIVDFLSEFVDWKKKKTNTDAYVGQIILIMGTITFNIHTYTVHEIVEDFSAIGCGMFAALGAMELGADPIRAVEVTMKYDAHCGGKVESLEIPILNAKK